MSEATHLCPTCGEDTPVYYEVDGPEVLEVWTDEDTDKLSCRGCGEAFDRDFVYDALSIHHAEESTCAAMERDE